MNRVRSKQGDVLVYKLKENLYTLTQRLESQIVRFFDIKRSDDNWDEKIDLNQIPILFEVFVVTSYVEKKFAVKKLKKAISSTEPYERFWIVPYNLLDPEFEGSRENVYGLGGKLVDLGNNYFSGCDAPIVKHHLNVKDDREILEKYELDWAWGAAIIERLIRYFETGINRDDMKFEVFPDLWDDREQLRPLTSRLAEPFR
ncbi:hypothetical protein RO21_05330 [[Actinobacillus] muris]|uniref:Uncharacterized protein n=1 Tax=Muribacter muris TaxID=67855 RepID=A0A0J5P7X8_9PAST|nr:hypothetical protein RO21_05330 [[Actinobacillus] muris] [Muribacter muris]